VRSRAPSPADHAPAALDPDAPMHIVTIEDIERDRRFDESGASSGSDEPEGRS
jgi:hypothetical protein